MRILVAEDDSVTRRLLKVSLERWKYEVTLAEDGRVALEILLGDDSPKLAILDWVMPGIDGVEVCRELRKREAGSYIYALLLTSKATKEDLLTGLEAGADDYLIKPFDLLELQARLWSGKRILELQEQLLAARETLQEQATHDALTEVWNRGAILDILRRECDRAGREQGSLSAIMSDIDHFKQINDTWGHQTGDAVLREVTRRMKSVLRSYDSIGRYGGEEFVVVAPGCAEDSALGLAEKLRNAVNKDLIHAYGNDVPVTVSLGVASRSRGRDPESILRYADEALYRAKNMGRDRSEVAVA